MGKKLNSLGEIGPLLEEFANDLLRASILETDARVKEASPVLSGRLRNRWMIGENSEAGQPAERKEYGENIARSSDQLHPRPRDDRQHLQHP